MSKNIVLTSPVKIDIDSNIIAEALSRYVNKSKKEGNPMLGTIDHKDRNDFMTPVSLSDVACIINDINFDVSIPAIKYDANILDTPNGKLIQELMDAGVKIKFSPSFIKYDDEHYEVHTIDIYPDYDQKFTLDDKIRRFILKFKYDDTAKIFNDELSYWFAVILSERFKLDDLYTVIMYNHSIKQFACQIEENLYNINGRLEKDENWIPWKEWYSANERERKLIERKYVYNGVPVNPDKLLFKPEVKYDENSNI